MPTGYTARLESMGYDVKRWLKESIIRNFGLCASLRDSGELSEEDIKNRLSKSSNDYCEATLKEHNKELEELLKYTEEDWKKRYLEKVKKARIDHCSRQKEYIEQKERHIGALKELRLLKQGEQSELLNNAIIFACEQLGQVIKCDFEGAEVYQDSILKQTLEEYKECCIDQLEERIEYYQLQIKPEVGGGRLDRYKEFVELVDKA